MRLKKETGYKIGRLFLVVIAITLFVWIAWTIIRFTYPFWLAAFFVWLFKPFSAIFIDKLKFPPGLAALTSLFIGLSLLGGVLTGITYLIVSWIERFAKKLPTWIEDAFWTVQDFINQTVWPIWQEISGAAETISDDSGFSLRSGLAEIGAQIGSALGQLAEKLADGLAQVALSVPTILVAFLFIILAIYFLGKDWERMNRFVRKNLPESVQEKMRSFHLSMRYRVFGYIKAQFTLMLITGFIVFIGLTILRVNGAFTLAIIVGIAELLPYLGTGTILIPWAIYLLLTGEIGFGIGIAILYTVTMIIRQTIEPKILSTSMNLNPLAVLISLFVGLQMFGALGLFLGPAILVIIVILIDIGVVDDIIHFIKYGFKTD